MSNSAVPIQTALGIDYLSKDFTSFRRLMLDRLAATAAGAFPGTPADLGTVLVELLAAAADRLSYYQDAVATESYLGTARLRTSVRRHARLLDYLMHDGCNARAFVTIEVAAGADGQLLPQGTALLTEQGGQPPIILPAEVVTLVSSGAQVFETLHDLTLHVDHNQISLFAPRPLETLAVGATTAMLANDSQRLHLHIGDVLIFEEFANADGGPGDPTHRCAVRLTAVQPQRDTATGRHIVSISWGSADGLPCQLVVAQTRAVGNVVLADHGYTLPQVETIAAPLPHERPALTYGPLTWQQLSITAGQPQLFSVTRAATSALPTSVEPSSLLQPAITLLDSQGQRWTARRDLLGSDPESFDFVVEVEEDGSTFLRFGDGVYGKRPAGTFQATYRVGNGTAGNIGAESLYHIASSIPGLLRARNPLAASGGIDPEPIDQVRLIAPSHLQVQARAVTTSDYQSVICGFPGVRNALVVRKWTGSWYTIMTTVQRSGGLPVDSEFAQQLRAYLDGYRMIGHDIQISGSIPVPLDLQLTIGVGSGYWASAVLDALKGTLSSSTWNGVQGFFHPDRLALGQALYASQIVAAAMAVPGLSWVQVTRFQRYNGQSQLVAGVIPFNPGEVPLVQNVVGSPQLGNLDILIGGGA